MVDVVNPPPPVSIGNYPSAIAVSVAVIMTAILIAVSSRMDRTRGVLTVSLLIIVSFIEVTAYCLIFTIPTDEVTPAVVGGLTAGFGAVVAYWLGRGRPGTGEPHDQPNGAPPSNGAKTD